MLACLEGQRIWEEILDGRGHLFCMRYKNGVTLKGVGGCLKVAWWVDAWCLACATNIFKAVSISGVICLRHSNQGNKLDGCYRGGCAKEVTTREGPIPISIESSVGHELTICLMPKLSKEGGLKLTPSGNMYKEVGSIVAREGSSLTSFPLLTVAQVSITFCLRFPRTTPNIGKRCWR